jgi:nicotinate-nucleotide pyrophosphorylase (carboxylating)
MTLDETTLELVRRALAEDVGSGDVTTQSAVPAGHRSRGTLLAKSGGILAGLNVARAVFLERDPGLRFEASLSDGDRLEPGVEIAAVEGATRGILTAERVALNFLQRLSGIATSTASCVAALAGSGTRVLDTRKTTPGLRILEKYAVRVGGGENHRMGLWDMVLIKDNHIEAAGGIAAAVEAARDAHPDLAVEVEAKTLDQVAAAIEARADRIMLDNMSTERMREAIALARAVEPSPEIEVSGGVTDEKLREIAELGPDFVSIGALTHSAPALDISLEVVPLDGRRPVESGGSPA